MQSPKLKVVAPTNGAQIETTEQADFFWFEKRKEWVINRERLLRVSSDLGFRYHSEALYQVVDKFIHKREPKFYFDTMKECILKDDKSIQEVISSAYETFIQKNGQFMITRLPAIDEATIAHDTKSTCYKFYKDSYIIITKDKITTHAYSELDGLIYANRIQSRVFKSGTKGKYIEFLNYACDMATTRDYVQNIIGYLCHEYKDETMGYIIVLTEQVQDPKAGGGTGKNIFCQLLSHTTTYTSKPGSQTKFDENFFQAWNGERIFTISDIPKNFDFIFLKEPSTGTFIYKKLWQNEQIIPSSQAPKFIVQTNYSYEIKDGGLRRRIIPLEFTDHFTKMQGVDTFFGCHFPGGWNAEDWAGYDGFITQSIQQWLRAGCKLQGRELSETGWQKQFELSYGQVVYGIIESCWDRWLELGFISNESFKQMTETYYNENSISLNFRPATSKVNKAVEEYCQHTGTGFIKDHVKRDGVVTIRGKLFSSQKELPF